MVLPFNFLNSPHCFCPGTNVNLILFYKPFGQGKLFILAKMAKYYQSCNFIFPGSCPFPG
ncbi:hypothetical protein A8C56_05600 [Niabella ginsenosidivorans]|uniref:Uncharacterized protein n=1 Tax=Niabella ginsenosidivorans TaxID=1176587 RepID=A0A1A9I1U4_9BACT|nr:hypothetical protein A8C56_05600 [Niabella ginsenosidivorans]